MKAATLPDLGQMELPLGDLVFPDHPEGATITERFAAFDKANRWVFYSLLMLTEDWLSKGNSRVSIDMLVHTLRWHHGRETTGGGRFKIDNSFTSRYARALIAERPEWESAFETRKLRAE